VHPARILATPMLKIQPFMRREMKLWPKRRQRSNVFAFSGFFRICSCYAEKKTALYLWKLPNNTCATFWELKRSMHIS